MTEQTKKPWTWTWEAPFRSWRMFGLVLFLAIPWSIGVTSILSLAFGFIEVSTK